jgi:hypothetical protein
LRFRVSIRRLMALVLLIAVGLAAAMAGAFTFAVVTLSALGLGALLSRGPSRAFFLGCSAFGWSSMLLAFGTGPEIRYSLPTIRPIIRAYEAINGPGPAAVVSSPEEASRAVIQTIETVNRAITVGHSLISLAVALTGGAFTWLIAKWWKYRAGRGENPSSVGGPLA